MRPPRWAEALLAFLLPHQERDEVLGDLAEAYRARATRGRVRATLWYVGQVILVPGWLLSATLGSLRFDGPEIVRTLRSLFREPGFTLVAVVSLGLGIGATTAIAGALNSLLFVSLPVDEPGELSLVYHSWPEQWERGQYGSSSSLDPRDGTDVVSNVSWPAYEVLRGAVAPEVDLAAYSFVRDLSMVWGDGPARAGSGMLVSGDYFSTLRLAMRTGRALNAADDRPGADPTAVLSYGFWQRAFGGDPDAVGATVLLNGAPFEVVGIADERYVGLSPGGFFGSTDVSVPMAFQDRFISMDLPGGQTLRSDAQTHWVRLIARVPPGTDRTALGRAWSGPLAAHMVESGVIQASTTADMEVRLLEGRRGLDSLRRDTQRPLEILTVAVVLVLLIACANLTTLLLARGASRSEEAALRRAIGASRWELARPQIVESLVLAVLGGGLGFFIALQGGPILVSSLTGGEGAAAVEYRIDGVLVSAAVLTALAAALVSAWIPAARVMRTEPGRHLGARSRGKVASRHRLGRVLVMAQIAVSIPLVVGAGLFLETLDNLASIDPGFDAEGLVVFRVDAALTTRDHDRQTRIYQEILRRLEETPGVRSAAIMENVLVSGWRSNGSVRIDGESQMMDMNAVSPGFFEAMRIEHRSGRVLSDEDVAGTPDVALVNETAQRELFAGRAIGRRIVLPRGRELEIVGVVADSKYAGIRETVQPTFFDPWLQRGGLYATHFAVRTDGSGLAIEPAIRRVVADVDAGLPVTALRTQGAELDAQADRERVFARLLSGFGGFALLLSAIGLYGTMSFMVRRRTGEIGVRLALGAAPRSILGLVMRQVAVLTTIGLVVGLAVAVQLAPVVGSMLFGVEPGDARTMATAAVVMVSVAIAAGILPAWRAARVDPMESLAPD